MTDVALGIPWFDSGCEYRRKNYNFIQQYVPTLYPFSNLFVSNGSGNSRGSARNELVYQAALHSCDAIVLCDADSFPHPDGLRAAIAGVLEGGGIHFPFAAQNYKGLTESSSNIVLGNKDPLHVAETLPSEDTTIGSFGGAFAVRPDDWFAAAGNPQFPVWGFEDIITVVCMRTLAEKHTSWHTPWTLTHLWHPKATDDRSTANQRMLQNAICQEFEAAQYDKVKVRDLLVQYRKYYEL